MKVNADNKILGNFDLLGIPGPAWRSQIEVTFDIDANGIVNVSAKDKATGKENSVAITSSGGLSDAQVEQMVQDAESHAEDDKKRKETIDAKNEADTLIYSADKNIQEHGANLPQEIKDEIQNAQMALRTAMEGDDLDALKEKIGDLQKAVMKIGEALSKGAGSGGASESGEGTTTDGEATEEKKEEEAK